jgi:hypothetical protein
MDVTCITKKSNENRIGGVAPVCQELEADQAASRNYRRRGRSAIHDAVASCPRLALAALTSLRSLRKLDCVLTK